MASDQPSTCTLTLGDLRTLIDEGDRAYADGRFTEVRNPSQVAADIIERGRQRAAARRPATCKPCE